MTIKQKADELTSLVNWNYIGLVAGVLSIIVTAYNISRYYEEIKNKEIE
jgi:hypothetical protein